MKLYKQISFFFSLLAITLIVSSCASNSCSDNSRTPSSYDDSYKIHDKEMMTGRMIDRTR